MSTWATALGMALVILSITSGRGLKFAISEKFRALEGDFVLRTYAPNRTADAGAIALDSALIADLGTDKAVEGLHPFTQKTALLVGEEKSSFEGMVITGVQEAYTASLEAKGILNVEKLNPGAALPEHRYGSWISKYTAQNLGLALGDTATLIILPKDNQVPKFRKSVVEGIYTSGLEEYDRQNVLITLRDGQRLNRWRKDSVSGYQVAIHPNHDAGTVANWWNAQVPFDVEVALLEDRYPALFQWIALFDTNILIVLGIVLIVAIANVITALMVLIIDRTTMIGTFKALGASNSMLQRVFQFMAMNYMGRGLLLGNALGLLASFAQWNWGIITLDPETYYLAVAPIYFDWPWIITANAIFIAVGYVLLFLPVKWIGRMHPMKSIRFS